MRWRRRTGRFWGRPEMCMICNTFRMVSTPVFFFDIFLHSVAGEEQEALYIWNMTNGGEYGM